LRGRRDSTVATQVRKYACHRHDVELKHDLVERGLTVDEIERIVRVRSTDKKRTVNV
jgi:hypothetical protein